MTEREKETERKKRERECVCRSYHNLLPAYCPAISSFSDHPSLVSVLVLVLASDFH